MNGGDSTLFIMDIIDRDLTIEERMSFLQRMQSTVDNNKNDNSIRIDYTGFQPYTSPELQLQSYDKRPVLLRKSGSYYYALDSFFQIEEEVCYL